MKAKLNDIAICKQHGTIFKVLHIDKLGTSSPGAKALKALYYNNLHKSPCCGLHSDWELRGVPEPYIKVIEFNGSGKAIVDLRWEASEWT
jgi:hypothetical protein